MKKTLLLATSIAVLAGIWTVIVVNIGKFGAVPFVLWPTFIAWAAFFYLGGTTEGLLKAWIQLWFGAILSGLFMWIYGLLGLNPDPGWIVLGIIVIIIAWPLTGMSAVSKWFSAVPAGLRGLLVRRQPTGQQPSHHHRRDNDPAAVRFAAGLAVALDRCQDYGREVITP